MKKYYLIARNMWDQTVIYRLNFTVWRLRMVLRLITTYFLWDVLLRQTGNFAGYTHTTILTYVLLTSLLEAIVFSSRSYELADDVNNGNLSNYLLKPFNYFLYHAARDIGDKAMNIAFFLVEFSLFFLVIHPPFFIQTNIVLLLLFLISIGIAVILCFFFNLLLGMIGFWSSDAWAPRFLFYIVLTFFSGAVIPLSMFPKGIYMLLQASPFGYLLFFPLQIYLGQIDTIAIYKGFVIGIGWSMGLYLLALAIWRKGLRMYTAQGR